MNHSGAHSYEDKLLEFAYGELPAVEAQAVETHLQGCARCAGALESIRGVRRTMSALEDEPAPAAGLDSLMAYAQQTARRLQAGPAPRPTWWRRLLVPVTGMAALAAVVLVVLRLPEDSAKLSPSAVLKEAAREQAVAQANEEGKGLDKAPEVAAAPAAQAPEPPREMDELVGGVAAGGRADTKRRAPAKDGYAQKKMKAPAKAFDESALAAVQKSAPGKAPLGEAAAEMQEREDFAQLQEKVARKLDTRGQATPAAKPVSGYVQAEDKASSSAAFGSAGAGPGGGGLSAEESAPRLSLRSRSVTNAPRDVADSDDFDREIARQEARSPAPPPPPAPSSMEPAPVMAAAPAPAPSKAEMHGAKDGAAEGDESSILMFTKLAEKARHGNDRKSEARYLQKAIDAGASGMQLAQILSQLCDAELALGSRQPASCERLLAEFPDSPYAQHAEFQTPALKRAAPAKAAPAKPAAAESAD